MAENKAKNVKPDEKLVKVRIPRDPNHKDPVIVYVNERNWLIERGKEVEIPECAAEVLKHQEEMLEIIDDFNDKNIKA